MSEQSEDSVRVLAEDAINAVVYVQLGLIEHAACILKHVVLQCVRVHRQLECVHLFDKGRVGGRNFAVIPSFFLVGERVRIHDVLRVGAHGMSNLADCFEVISFRVAAKLNEGQVRQSGKLLKPCKLKGLNDDWDFILAVLNRSKIVRIESIEQELSKVVTRGYDLTLIVLDLDIETDLGVAVRDSGSVCVQQFDGVN